MDAGFPRIGLGAFGLLLLGGCTLGNPSPATAPDANGPGKGASRRQEPPQVVATQPAAPDADTSAPVGEDNVARSVEEFIQRIDDARTRTDVNRALPDHREPFEQVADVNALPPNIRVIAPPPAEEPAASPAEGAQNPPEEAPIESPASQPVAPQLGAVNVRPTAPLAAGAGHPDAPEVNGSATARSAPASLEDFIARLAPSEDPSFREQLDRRMLWVLAGNYERAREPLELVTAEQQILATRFIEALVVIRAGHMGDPSGSATAAARELAALQEALCRQADLQIPVIQVCSAVYSFGQYDALSPARFSAGAATEFVLYCELSDFVCELKDDGQYHSVFDLTTTILNRVGDSVFELKDPEIVDRCRNRRRDCFIPRLVRLPATLSPGQYVAKVTIVDKLGQKVAENRAAFELVARP